MSYGKVHDVFWEDEKIDSLSDRAAMLALFMITGPHRNAIGCFRLGVGAITDMPRFGAWGIEGASEALNELVEIGFCVRDERTGWTFITNALKHDPIKQDKAAVHALSLANRVPKNTVVYQRLVERLGPQLQAHAKALEGKEGWPLEAQGRPIEGASKAQPSPSPEPSPLPEHESPPKPPQGGESSSKSRKRRKKAREYDAEFLAWWEKYPKREAKGDAFDAYWAMRDGGHSHETLVAGAAWAAKKYADTEDRFIPLPATFLRGERFLAATEGTGNREPPEPPEGFDPVEWYANRMWENGTTQH